MNIIIAILIYFALLVLISLFFRRGGGSNESYFLGNRKSPWYIVAFGMVGASLSGVTFVSVPGWVQSIGFTYMQMVFGFLFGYIIVAKVLLPIYYKFNFITIYTYLKNRFGIYSYKTGASFFLLSKSIGAAARLYIVVIILKIFILDRVTTFDIPFWVIVLGLMTVIGLYTFRNGIKTIVWTDTLQTFIMIATLCIIIFEVTSQLNLTDLRETVSVIAASDYSRIFVFDDWHSRQHFLKQFLSGIFVVIVMTGLDQDMMQKNLTCKTLKESQRNMYTYGFMFIPLNLLFLSLGALLLILAQQNQIALPELGDEMLPFMVANGHLGEITMYLFAIGIIAAALSSVDSAITSLTTSFYVDILEKETAEDPTVRAKHKSRNFIHFGFCLLFVILILLLNSFDNKTMIDVIFTLVAYTYGPLLGMFAFGLFTKRVPKDKYIPYIAVLSPVLIFILDISSRHFWGYRFGHELLMINGLITFLGILITSSPTPKRGDIEA